MGVSVNGLAGAAAFGVPDNSGELNGRKQFEIDNPWQRSPVPVSAMASLAAEALRMTVRGADMDRTYPERELPQQWVVVRRFALFCRSDQLSSSPLDLLGRNLTKPFQGVFAVAVAHASLPDSLYQQVNVAVIGFAVDRKRSFVFAAVSVRIVGPASYA